MKKPHGWLVVAMVVIYGITFSSIHAQEYPDYDVSVRTNPNEVTVGDLIDITVEISHKEDVIFTITEPILPSGMDIVSSEDQISIFDRTSGDLVISSRTFKVASYVLDLQASGYIDLLWVDSKLGTGKVSIDLPQINIYPTRNKDDGSLRPLAPLFREEGFYSFNYQELLAISGFFLLIAYLLLRIRKRTSKEGTFPIQHDEDIATNRLSLLRGVSLDSVKNYREFYQSIDRIIRQYISSRYNMQASSLTVKELIVLGDLAQIDKWQLRLIRDLLNRCDEVIYGNILPDPILADRDLTIAYEIIELNRGSVSGEITTRDIEHEI
ncbi:MAG: hypothetical protein CL752_04100 [Chloroflexi bacterium]|nr:hypothetical protein [Chloroflexota bacterium]|tara:strand:+ start:9626 stop:10597 length:972 start_codon:yes stop_codon:yes gene_type:complete